MMTDDEYYENKEYCFSWREFISILHFYSIFKEIFHLKVENYPRAECRVLLPKSLLKRSLLSSADIDMGPSVVRSLSAETNLQK